MNQRGRRRAVGVDVYPELIRRARIAAGLSLADVAGSELTRSAVHRVETGKARPSMRTLRLIAERTGADAAGFMRAGSPDRDGRGVPGTDSEEDRGRHPLELARLEAMVAEGRHDEAAARADELLEHWTDEGSVARLHYWAGVARVQLHEASMARSHLRIAYEAFVRAHDAWMEVECLGWEAAALSIDEDRSAVDVATEALRRCRELDPVPALTESRILGHLAGIYLSLHEWERAIAAYGGALHAAGNIRNLASLVNVYDGMSIAYQGSGDLVTATAYAQRAVALSTVASNQLVLARLENNLGVLLLRGEHWRDAEEHLLAALAHCEAGDVETGKSHVLLSLAQLAFAQQQYGRAEALAREAIDLAAAIGEQLTRSLALQWLGKILAAAGRDREAVQAFELALSQLADMAVPRRLASCHREYAEVLERQGQLKAAVEHWRMAADLWQAPVDDAIGGTAWLERDVQRTS